MGYGETLREYFDEIDQVSIVLKDDGQTTIFIRGEHVVLPTQALRDLFNGVYRDESFTFKASGTYR